MAPEGIVNVHPTVLRQVISLQEAEILRLREELALISEEAHLPTALTNLRGRLEISPQHKNPRLAG